MKKYKDLKFKRHPIGNGIQARMFFNNGYGISVVEFRGSYGLECTVLKGTEEEYEICYNTHITNDVIGYNTIKSIDKIMKQIQELEK